MTGEDLPTCEVCGAWPSIECTVWYGTKLGEKRDRVAGVIRSTYRVAGSQSIHYCPNCILKYRLRKLGWAVLVVAIGFTLLLVLGNIVAGDLSGWLRFAGLMTIISGLTLFAEPSKNERELGARMLRDARRRELYDQGYDVFWYSDPEPGAGST